MNEASFGGKDGGLQNIPPKELSMMTAAVWYGENV